MTPVPENAVAAAARAAERTARLQAVIAALSESLTAAQVAEVIVGQGVGALSAAAGSMILLDGDQETLRVVKAVGYPDAVMQMWRQFPLAAHTPLADAIRSGRAIFLESVEETVGRYPELDALIPALGHRALAALPLVVEKRALGGIGLSFTEPRVFDAEERAFMESLAHQCAQAIERARLFEALRESEARFRTMAEAAPVLLWMAGLDGGGNYFNNKWLAFTGRTMEQERGEGWAEGVHPDDRQNCLDLYRASFVARRGFRLEYRLRRADGAWRWLLNEGAPRLSPDGGFAGFIGSCVDITERKQAEQENLRLLAEVRDAAVQQRLFLRDILSSVTEGRLRLCSSEDDFPRTLTPWHDPPVTLTRQSLRSLRLQIERAAEAVEMPTERWYDLETAVGEAGMNAVVHAGGGEGRVHADPASGTLQVWVRDQGTGIAIDSLHRATLERGFTTAGTLGHGFWMILKTCDRVFLLTGPEGTTVVLEQGRAPSPIPWLLQM